MCGKKILLKLDIIRKMYGNKNIAKKSVNQSLERLPHVLIFAIVKASPKRLAIQNRREGKYT